MSIDGEGIAEPIDTHFLATVATMSGPTGPGALDGGPLSASVALALFDAQAASRHLDLAARLLRAQGQGFYTIGSAGHESNAAVAAVLRPTDPALLHYRSGAFYVARGQQVPGSDPVRDVLLGLVAATSDPISGGRHKVFGNHALAVIPQTSTIASHLPRAVGVAFAIDRAAKLRVDSPWPKDALAVTSFGDASANHSTTQGSLNTAAWISHQGLPLPVLFVCEDNGLGISVRTPAGWTAANLAGRESIAYFRADGADPVATYEAAATAADHVRRLRRPAVLHLQTVRFMGHAGSDAEVSYRSPAQISADYSRDPLLGTASLLVAGGVLTPLQIIERYEAIRADVLATAEAAVKEAKLDSAAAVMAPLAPRHPDAVAAQAARSAPAAARDSAFGAKLPETEGGLTFALAVNRSLADLLTLYPQAQVFGEDVAVKGGVYGVTRGLLKAFGAGRVFDTLLDEQAILGLALGSGVSGFLPIPEIQYLAYLHNAEDQLRGEAATLQFFSNGQYRNPMVVRIAGYGYQKGFGGHFHNDDSVAVLRDLPGVVVASPSRPDDAAAMLRTCLAGAAVDGSVCVFLEPIALYHTRDLYEPSDGGWLAPYTPPADWAAGHVPIGKGRTYGDGSDLTLITCGNGVPMSLRVARRLADDHISTRVLDLRWLAPLPVEDILREATATGRVLVVDETRRSGGVSEGVLTALVDAGFSGAMARVTSEDSFIPLGDAALQVLLSEDTIESAAHDLLRRGR
ncbi:MAG TPA: thiamine pyrophosphate-dependent enzyme [Candidatus Nanopelagicales bacterium]|jgi:2-oxoisovalerate dehydrogenase E1 component